MVDTGANGYTFINQKTVRIAWKLLNLTRTELPKPIPVTGFDDNQKHQLTHVTKAHLCINRRNESEVPFLELDIGAHNIILGWKWLAVNDILVNYRRRRLIWPKDRPREAPPEIILTEVNNQPAKLPNIRANTTH